MQLQKYFEKKVSLVSTSDVRYNGKLYTFDPTQQSITLKHGLYFCYNISINNKFCCCYILFVVNCMGTEGRRTGDQAIPPSDCIYEFIIFRVINIHKLWLEEGNEIIRDVTDEILTPLRNSNNSNKYIQQKYRNISDNVDLQQPKRKIGYSQVCRICDLFLMCFSMCLFD